MRFLLYSSADIGKSLTPSMLFSSMMPAGLGQDCPADPVRVLLQIFVRVAFILPYRIR